MKTLDTIKRKRRYLKMSQQDIAYHLGVTRSAYAQFELGHSKINYLKFFAVLRFLNIDYQDIYEELQEDYYKSL